MSADAAQTDFRRGLAWLTAAAFVARAAFLLLEPATQPVADERTWLDWAGILLSDRVRLHPLRTAMIFYPPVYPYLLAALLGSFGSLVAIKWVQVVASTALVPALGLVGARVFGPRAGLAAAGIAALYPEFVWFSVHFWSETLFMTLVWWAVERLLAADASASLRRAAFAGLLLGLAILTRETVLYLTPLAALWLAVGARSAHGVRRGAALLLVALAVVAPWTWRNWEKFGAFVPVSTAGGLNLYQGNAPLTRQEVYDRYDAVRGRVEQYQWARREGLKAILERQPGWAFEKLRDEMPKFWEADSLALIHIKRGAYGEVPFASARLAAAVIILPFLAVLAGFVLALAARRLDRQSAFLLGFLVFYNALHVITHGFARYRLPVLPVVLLFAGWTLSALASRQWPPLGAGRRRLLAVLALAAAITVAPSLRLNYEHPAFGFVSGGPR